MTSECSASALESNNGCADECEETTDGTDSISVNSKPLSKNQIKKQKKKEKWLQIKAEKRLAEKEKRKKRFAEMRERGEDLGPSRKSLKRKRMVDSSCRLKVAIDCSFDQFMTEKDTTFLVQQIQHSYAANRRAENPLQLYVCGIAGKAKQRLDSIGDYKGWDLHKEEREYTEVFGKEDIVYLSSESPNVLDRLDENKVYVIGGLVDHNHHKGLCHKLAEEKGLEHAQLPIGQFLQLKSRKVLTINHVFEILLRYTETKDWQASFLSVLPQRKGACAKGSQDKDSQDKDSQDKDSQDKVSQDKVSQDKDTSAVVGVRSAGNSGDSCGSSETKVSHVITTATTQESVEGVEDATRNSEDVTLPQGVDLSVQQGL